MKPQAESSSAEDARSNYRFQVKQDAVLVVDKNLNVMVPDLQVVQMEIIRSVGNHESRLSRNHSIMTLTSQNTKTMTRRRLADGPVKRRKRRKKDERQEKQPASVQGIRQSR